MKRQVFLLVFFVLSTLLVNAQIQEDDEVGTRGSFLSTRPSVTSTVKSTKSTTKTTKPKTSSNSNVGLGYTLYLKGKDENPVRVSPAQEFKEGDAIRLVFEPNVDGYLYVFHTENDKDPTMIFPDPRLKRGDNLVEAHVPYEVPASDDADDSLRWFVFDEKSAIEKLYVVLSKEPLTEIPSSEQLVRYCEQKLCPWKPTEKIWQDISSKANQNVKVSKNAKDQGQAQSEGEKRSIKALTALEKKAASPTVIYLSRSVELNQIVTPISLVHK